VRSAKEVKAHNGTIGRFWQSCGAFLYRVSIIMNPTLWAFFIMLGQEERTKS